MEDEESPSESTSRSTFRRIQETRSSNYSTYKMNMHVEKNLINLNNVLAGNETNNIEPNSQSNISLKTTKTKTNVWKHVIQQSSGEIKCNLCSSSSKVIYLFL